MGFSAWEAKGGGGVLTLDLLNRGLDAAKNDNRPGYWLVTQKQVDRWIAERGEAWTYAFMNDDYCEDCKDFHLDPCRRYDGRNSQ